MDLRTRPHVRQRRLDLAAAHAAQDGYKLTPLSQWGNALGTPTKGEAIWRPLDPKADPLADWKTINRAMVEVPPPARDADMLQSFARLGIGPGLDVQAQDASTKRGLARAAADAKKIIAEAFTAGYLQKNVNGWNYPPPATGRPSQSRDWLFRAVQMLAGFVANDPVEATYLNVSVDGDGKPLTGQNRYVIHFDKGGQPKVSAFWSFTLYNMQYNLVANPINRYSVGDRSGLKPDADGGLPFTCRRVRRAPTRTAIGCRHQRDSFSCTFVPTCRKRTSCSRRGSRPPSSEWGSRAHPMQ